MFGLFSFCCMCLWFNCVCSYLGRNWVVTHNRKLSCLTWICICLTWTKRELNEQGQSGKWGYNRVIRGHDLTELEWGYNEVLV